MSAIRKRFRIERTFPSEAWSAPEAAPAPVAAPAPRVERSVPEASNSEEPARLARLAAELQALRGAISTTKRELAELKRSPSGQEGIHRAAGELDAVSAATEEATTSILGAVEEIELTANLIRSSGLEGAGADPVGVILERVLALYEACNFQDITGQRIRKVVTTLKFVEERLDAVTAAWNGSSGEGASSALAGASGTLPLAGPGMPGEAGRVSQADVDAYFA